MIFIDSNVPMYLVGVSHPHKLDAQILLQRASVSGERLVTDAEVLQEILHRYAAIDRREAIVPTMQLMLSVVDEVFPIEKTDAVRAAEILQSSRPFSARDAIHVAVMERYGVGSILSFDSDFEKWPGLKRIYQGVTTPCV